MAETNYWSTEGNEGVIRISEDVVASIAAIAVGETEGVSGLCAGIGSDIVGLLGKKNLSGGVKIQFRGDTVLADIGFLVTYGFPVRNVAKNVQEAVKTAIQSMTGLQVGSVNVRVQGVTFPQKADAAPAEAPRDSEA